MSAAQVKGGHDDFATEPVLGLPERPPVGEDLLWQGRPASFALAREAFKINWIAGYFVVLAAWRAMVIADGSIASIVAVMLPYIGIGLVACSILYLIALVQARSTVYTITTARVAMRIGAALTVTLNLPFKQVGSANLSRKSNGTGNIALDTLGDTRISYLVCWPHVRPWHFAKTQPTLRAIPDVAQVAKILAQAAEMRLNEPVVSMVTPVLSMAAE